MSEVQVGRTVAAIGRKANVAVNEGGKPATAHDLRRSFGQRMADAGVPVRLLQKMMRHASFTTTELFYLRDRVQDQARVLGEKLRHVVSGRSTRPCRLVDVLATASPQSARP